MGSSKTRLDQSWWGWVSTCWVSACWVSACVACALGCGDRTPECHGPRCEPVEVHVLTWWLPTNNSPAIPLKEAVQEEPGVAGVTLSHRATKNAMMAAVESLLLHEEGTERVDTFLANAGRDVLRWTPCGGGGGGGAEGSAELGGERLLQLDGPEGYPDLRSRFAPEVLAGVSCCPAAGCSDPGIYALPLGLHQINHIVYNVARFEACGSHRVSDDQGFIELLECLGAGGQRVISAPVRDCSAHCAASAAECRDCSGVAGESLSYLLESLVLLVSDRAAYQSYWRGQGWQSPNAAQVAAPLRRALALLEGELARFLNNCPDGADACASPASAEDALEEVRAGSAAFMVMPDWFMLRALQNSNEEVAGMAFPGTDDTFLFMTDVFAIPGPSTPGTSIEAGFRWLDALLDRGLQERFASQKSARAALAGDDRPRLPSLEAQLPASIDPAELRSALNHWLSGRRSGGAPSTGLEGVMEAQFAQAAAEGTLRVGACGDVPCGGR